MTIWGNAVFSYRSLLHGEAAFSLLPMEGGAPKGRRLESPRYEREYEESGLSYRQPERSRGIFYVVAVFCTYEVMIKSPRCFGCFLSDALRLTVVQGRFLASLEMTIRGKRYSRIVNLLHGEAAFSLLPMEGGAPKGRRLESPRYEREYEESVLSYRHPERSRGIFYVAAVLCTYEVMIKSPRCFGCSSSDALRLTFVQGRFLAALEMTRGGRTVIR